MFFFSSYNTAEKAQSVCWSWSEWHNRRRYEM